MDFNATVLVYLVSVTVRSLGLAAAALGVVLMCRIKGAAALHAICTAVVAGMLALAALSPVLPPLPLRVLTPQVGQVPDLPIPPLEAANSGANHPVTPPLAPDAPHRISWQQIAVVAYAAGVLAFLIRLAFGYLFTRRLVRASRAVDCPWATEVYESSWISVPLTVGCLRPKILLPLGWDEWDAAKLQAVMAHEGTHVGRGDWAIAVVAGLNRCVFWYHPLAWWLERRLAFLAEQACDDSALLLVGTGPYAQALLDMAAAVKAGQGRLVWEAMAMANVTEVRHRIERILDETRQIPKGLTRSRWAALIACSLPLIYVASVVQLAPAQQEQLVFPRQEISTPRKSSYTTPAPSQMSEQMRAKQQLTPADAAQMEQHLAANPHDLELRSQLVVYYFDHGVREPRLSHIFWLIANHPESTQALFTSRGITASTTALNDASDYTHASGLWKQQAASHANEPRVLANAADFLSQPGGDLDEAERLLIAAHSAEPGNMQWSNKLAQLYTTAIVGSSGDPQFKNVNSAFADRVKLQLENSTDGWILRQTGGMLARIALRPQPGQKLPDTVLNLDEHPMLIPVVELGNRLIARSQQFMTGVVSGIAGRVPSGQPAPGQVLQDVITQIPAPPQPMAPSLSTVPSLISKVDPMYPALALQARISSDVRLMVQIGTDGHVQQIQVVSGHPLLAPHAVEAVKQWVYAPIPAAGTIQVTVPFHVDGGNTPLGTMTPGQLQTAREQQINGIVGGVPGGIAGGVVGGVLGGVIGSVPSNSPRVKIGGAVAASKLVSKVDPVYPEQARAAGIEGDVVLDVTVGEDGHVQAVEPKDGNPLLATAAVDAVRQWVYQPTYLNGEPVSVSTTVTVPFKLQ